MKKMEFAKIISTSFLLAMFSGGIKDVKADVSISSDVHMPKVAVTEFDMTDTKMSESTVVAETDTQTATVTINATEKTLYALDDWAKEYISAPKGTDSFQIVVSGATNVSYEVASGDSVTVSAKGVVKPAYETWYWYGNVGSTAKRENEEPTSVESSCNYGDSVVRVTAGAKTFNVKIHVNNYAITYADKVMDDYIAKNIKSNMRD